MLFFSFLGKQKCKTKIKLLLELKQNAQFDSSYSVDIYILFPKYSYEFVKYKGHINHNQTKYYTHECTHPFWIYRITTNNTNLSSQFEKEWDESAAMIWIYRATRNTEAIKNELHYKIV